MQPPPITTASAPNSTPNYAITLATIGAVLAILAVPFAFIPFLGLAGSCLILGLIVGLTIWTHRKRALIGTGLAFLAVIISMFSAFACVSAIVQSRNNAVAKVQEVQLQLQTLKAQASNTSDKNDLGKLIKVLGGDDISNDQAKALGSVGSWLLDAFADNKGSSDQGKK
jgi:uncharacterized membrane protein YfhO